MGKGKVDEKEKKKKQIKREKNKHPLKKKKQKKKKKGKRSILKKEKIKNTNTRVFKSIIFSCTFFLRTQGKNSNPERASVTDNEEHHSMRNSRKPDETPATRATTPTPCIASKPTALLNEFHPSPAFPIKYKKLPRMTPGTRPQYNNDHRT